ncbi:MAG: hypothetical protein ACW97W_03325 [Candidatus Hodarchaeales archaeon]
MEIAKVLEETEDRQKSGKNVDIDIPNEVTDIKTLTVGSAT